MAICENCKDLERKVAVLRNRLAIFGKYDDLLKDRLEDVVLSTIEKQKKFFSLPSGQKANISNSRLAEAQAEVSSRLFDQIVALSELPAKAEQMQAKTENTRTRTALAEADTRLKEEKIKGLQADRALKEEQARFLGAASLALARYANTGNMVEADFEVIDQLKQIGVKIPARLVGKKPKQINGAR